MHLLLNKSVVDLSDIEVSIDTTDYEVVKEDNTITVTRTNMKQDKKVNAKLILTCEEWVEEVKVPVTLSVNNKTPKVKLSAKTVQLNSNAKLAAYDEAQIQVTWKDTAAFEPEKITVTAANVASQNVLNKDIMFVVDENTIIVKQNGQATPGNYSFQVNVTTDSGYTASEKLSVKVKETPIDKVVKVSAKGSIDVLNRENSYIEVTPKLTAVNGTITKAEVAGKFANIFEEPVLAGGKIYLYVKDDATLITKYNYLVNLVLTVENASGEETKISTNDLKIKLKQGKPKFVATPKKEVCYSNAYNSVTVDLSATLKGAKDPVITNVELLNNTNAFAYSYDDATQQITITLKDNGEAAKGKNYTLQFKLTIEGQAENEKANVVKYTVSVK